MGNIGSSGTRHRRRNSSHNNPPPSPTPNPNPPESTGNRYVFAAAPAYPTPYPNPNPNTNMPQQYYQYPGYLHPLQQPIQLPAPIDQPHHNGGGGIHSDPAHANWVGRRYLYGPVPPFPAPSVEHQKADTIRNDVNIKKETLRIEHDVQDPEKYLVTFTFDATVAGSITIIFFAKEGADCNLTPMKEILEPITMSFKGGLGQKFRQPPGTGINFSMFEESDLLKIGDMEVYPLAVKAESCPNEGNDGSVAGNPMPETLNSQITQAIFEKKEKGDYQVRVVKQILWDNNTRYELQDIYGIGNSVGSNFDASHPGKECVICLSEQRDTTALPCRHMCMCSGCAKVLRFQTNRCPICQQPVERLLEIKISNKPEE